MYPTTFNSSLSRFLLQNVQTKNQKTIKKLLINQKNEYNDLLDLKQQSLFISNFSLIFILKIFLNIPEDHQNTQLKIEAAESFSTTMYALFHSDGFCCKKTH